ncbi:YbgF trimerization domain-containing protein, partial [Thiolapillus sp.]
MSNTGLRLSAVLLLGLPLVAGAAEPAKPSADLEARLARIERQLDNRGLVELMVKLEALQAEVQKLRGENEVLAHKLDEMKKRQRDLYLDLDRRLVQLERGGVAAAPAPRAGGESTTPATAATTPPAPPVNP